MYGGKGTISNEADSNGVTIAVNNIEYFFDGKTGFLYPANEHSHAVDIAVKLLSDPDIKKMAKNEAIIHSHNFEKNKVVSVYEDFYLESINTKPAYKFLKNKVFVDVNQYYADSQTTNVYELALEIHF